MIDGSPLPGLHINGVGPISLLMKVERLKIHQLVVLMSMVIMYGKMAKLKQA